MKPLDSAKSEKLAVAYIRDDGEWDRDFLALYLPTHILSRLDDVAWPENNESDSLAWRMSSSGTFSFKQAYKYLQEPQSHTSNFSFSVIWSWKGPERVRLFLWRIVNDSLMTNKARFNHRISSSGLCPRCLTGSEDQLHALRDCPSIQNLWRALLHDKQQRNFFDLDMTPWLEQNLRSREQQWNITFSIALDSIWKARNMLGFQDKITTVQELNHEIQARTAAVIHSLDESPLSNSLIKSSNPRLSIAWSPPPLGTLKLNCDGAVVANGGRVACGGIIRDSYGCPQFSYICNIGPCSVLNAKLSAIYYGLKLVREKSITEPIQVESDSSLAICFLRDGVVQTHESYHMLNKIVDIAKEINLESYGHIFREANFVADAFAKKGLACSNGLQVFNVAPVCAIIPLLADSANIHFRRGL